MLRRILPRMLFAVGLAACREDTNIPLNVVGNMDTDTSSGEMPKMSEHDHDSGRLGVDTGLTFSHGQLYIQDVWARPAHRNDTSAVYFTMKNNGQQMDRFLGATTEIATSVELHSTTMDDDIMQMKKLSTGMELPSGGHLALAPGKHHLMLINE